MKFDFIFLGQSVLKYETPLDVFTTINQIYEQNFNTLHKANKQLVGKIANEHSLFYDGEDESKVQRHNRLPMNLKDWFLEVFKHYLTFNKIIEYKKKLKNNFNIPCVSIGADLKKPIGASGYVYFSWNYYKKNKDKYNTRFFKIYD